MGASACFARNRLARNALAPLGHTLQTALKGRAAEGMEELRPSAIPNFAPGKRMA